MNEDQAVDQPDSPSAIEPRALLADWANSGDEWVRFLVSDILATGRVASEAVLDQAYTLFRQEKALDERSMPPVPGLSIEARQDEQAPPLAVTKLSDVHGVNALVTGAVIEPHEGLTILYGENGTGKTGYSRIFKALAGSRTADEILGDIDAAEAEEQSAAIEYQLGGEAQAMAWAGERGVSPFTRMSIFDSFSVTAHVDEDLEYVYVPAALALFTHVTTAIQGVSARIDTSVAGLGRGNTSLLTRFPRNSSVYPLIETLGASTDLESLRAHATTDPKIEEKIEGVRQTVAALQANTLATQLSGRKRELRVLEQASQAVSVIRALDVTAYNETVVQRGQLVKDYAAFRTQLFSGVDLPAEPDDNWSQFVHAGERYRQHLVDIDAHDADRCLYCRQPLQYPARELLAKYSTYLADKISNDIRSAGMKLDEFRQTVSSLVVAEISPFVAEYRDEEVKPTFFDAVTAVEEARAGLASATDAGVAASVDVAPSAAHEATLVTALAQARTDIADLEEQVRHREDSLAENQKQLAELTAAAELTKSWAAIDTQVREAKEADRLLILKRPLSQLGRNVTELSKQASDELINHSFDKLFLEECEALRGPTIKVQFVGREGAARRRKVLGSTRHKPSKVLSEGEQKVLAMADFLAEARLAGITAPVIFDDPVSSLDHRRINEVAQRVANLAGDHQVIVFTHDIFFATTLLALFEKSKRCSYFQITDEAGKGKVTAATGPRWDTLSNIRGRINATIQTANSQDGEARAALVERGYSLIRSWCEVFTETELLRGVTQRYQPNIGMTKLPQIKADTLPQIIETVTRVFEEACRFIDGHSQPLVTLGVSPTLTGLETHWAELQECKKTNDSV